MVHHIFRSIYVLVIAQLEDIIHKQIYDSAPCILTTTRIETEYEDIYQNVLSKVKTIYDIREIIKEDNYPELHSINHPKIFKNLVKRSELILSGKQIELNALLEYDAQINNKIPTSRILFGTQVSQNLEKIYAAFALTSTQYLFNDCQTIINKCISEKLYAEHEKTDLIKYAIKSLYLYNKYFFNLTTPEGININDCVIIENGCKNAANIIRKNFTNENIKNADTLHEILSCATVLENISYTGTVLCFVGGIKASEYNKTNRLDEIDGFIYFPSRNKNSVFAILVEAKNYQKGENDANKQLKETISFLSPELHSEITLLSKCAYMELKIKGASLEKK